MKNISKIKAFSLPEIIVYVAIFSVILLALTQTVVVVSKSFELTRGERVIDASALSEYDRLGREIRNATNVNTANSVFNASPGILAITVGSSVGASQIIRKFYLANGKIEVSDNGVVQGDLTSDEATTTSLVFRLITATSTQAVRIETTIAAPANAPIASENFYDTFVVRNTYEH